MSTATNILLRHNYIAIPIANDKVDAAALATVMMNLSYYGFALSAEGYQAITKLGTTMFASWWSDVETELKKITGADRKIGDFVVYKNFPAEVLEKSEAEYWIPQILMYWGLPNDLFTQEVKPRAKLNEQPKATVLRRAGRDTFENICTSYLMAPARWKDQEFQDVAFLVQEFPITIAKLQFKENLVRLATHLMKSEKSLRIRTATDVLRLAAGLSDGDISLRENTKFISFKKPVRKYLLDLLERCDNIAEDVARRAEMWKRFLHQLHPGDHKKRYPRVCKVVDDLYHDRLTTFNSAVEALLLNKNDEVLSLLSERPGEFRRRLAHTLDLFGDKAVNAFLSEKVLNGLTTHQVVSLRSHLELVNHRLSRVFPPKGNWNKLQIGAPRPIDDSQQYTLFEALGKVLSSRIPKVNLDPATRMIKLPNNGEEGAYTRGTAFPIPDDVEFIRTASYWKHKSGRNAWFDNGWNFFDTNWNSVGSCCWTHPKFGYKETAAVFSGDPTNSKDMEGRAAQLIDLYPTKLKEMGVRYAVWNILCYSGIKFETAEEVFAALQWGKDPQSGNLFEPSRCQLSFPLKGDQLTKYICLIDLEKREMVYLDANLHGDVHSADRNNETLAKNMPAFMEYLKALPSVYDLFCESIDKDSKTYILYSDKETDLQKVSAYVFKPENKDNKYKAVNINKLLD